MCINELQKFINQFEPDVIHSHLWESEMLLTQINCNCALRVTHFHDNMHQIKNKTFPTNKTQIANKYERNEFLSSRKNIFICISNDTFNFAKSNLPKKYKSKIKLLPNAIDCSSFLNKKTRNFNKIKLINIEVLKKKNQIFILYVLEEILNKNYDATLHFRDGPSIDQVKKTAKVLNLEKNIVFTGFENVKPF